MPDEAVTAGPPSTPGHDAEPDKAASRSYPARPILGVLAVVVRGDRVLLIERGQNPNKGKWGFPGGILELGETVAAGAMRELLEETGVEAMPRGNLTLLDAIHRDAEGRVRFHYVLLPVLATWRAGEGAPADDASDLAWLTRRDIEAGPRPMLPDVMRLADLAFGRLSER